MMHFLWNVNGKMRKTKENNIVNVLVCCEKI